VPAPIATQPAAPTRVAPQSPSVPVAPRPHPQAAPAAAPPASAAKPNCNPPYEFDESGNKRWKRECL
jgi:hypothetical protein